MRYRRVFPISVRRVLNIIQLRLYSKNKLELKQLKLNVWSTRIDNLFKILQAVAIPIGVYFGWQEFVQPELKEKIVYMEGKISSMQERIESDSTRLAQLNLMIANQRSVNDSLSQVTGNMIKLLNKSKSYSRICDSLNDELVIELNELYSTHIEMSNFYEQRAEDWICFPFREGSIDYSSFNPTMYPGSQLKNLGLFKNRDKIELFILQNPALFSPIDGTVTVINDTGVNDIVVVSNTEFEFIFVGVQANYELQSGMNLSKCDILGQATSDYQRNFSVGITLFDKKKGQFVPSSSILFGN